MGSILIIHNDYDIDPALQKILKQEYTVHVAQDTWEGLDIIDENHIDIFVIMSNNHFETTIENFLKELRKIRSDVTPIIFISKKSTEALNLEILKNGGWYFIEYPIDNQAFLIMIKNAMKIANALDDRMILLKKKRHTYPYQVKNIIRIQRSRDRYIKVYSRNILTHIEETEEFFYDAPLSNFPIEHGIEKQLKQAYQSWLVNISEIKKINEPDMELEMINGTKVPLSRKYSENFGIKK